MRTRTGTVVLHLIWGLGAKVCSQVKIRYLQLTLKKSLGRPIDHFSICQVQLLVFLLVLEDTDLSLVEHQMKWLAYI